MIKRADAADAGLAPENATRLNRRFYEGKPWVYFDRRLMHLARIAADAEGYDASFAHPARIGELSVTVHRRALSDDEPAGLDDQSFVAAEAQVLFHHVAETLLRLSTPTFRRPTHPHWPVLGSRCDVRRAQSFSSG